MGGLHDAAILPLPETSVSEGAPATVGGESPRKMPERTALRPAVLVTVIWTAPPVPTVNGKCAHAPLANELARLTVRGPSPSSTVMVSWRPMLSQSTAYRCNVPLYAELKFNCSWIVLPCQVAARRSVCEAFSRARTSVVGDAHVKRSVTCAVKLRLA